LITPTESLVVEVLLDLLMSHIHYFPDFSLQLGIHVLEVQDSVLQLTYFLCFLDEFLADPVQLGFPLRVLEQVGLLHDAAAPDEDGTELLARENQELVDLFHLAAALLQLVHEQLQFFGFALTLLPQVAHFLADPVQILGFLLGVQILPTQI